LDPDHRSSWREQLYVIIFESDTPPGKLFDLLLIVAIAASVIVVMFDSVASIHARYGMLLRVLEWGFTLLFTAEYVLRILCVEQPKKYVFSFFGMVDLLAIVPTYVSILLPGTEFMSIVRALRILRVFRILKLGAYLSEANILLLSLKASRKKIEVFVLAVILLVIIFGSLMYLIEGEKNGFTSIPRSIYWAIVTLTTVGYGDIAPRTPLGQALASFIMICGYGIIAVPTGIVSAEMVRATGEGREHKICPGCKAAYHDSDAEFCKYCGGELQARRSAAIE
jgi:voltage-gated potassium channel